MLKSREMGEIYFTINAYSYLSGGPKHTHKQKNVVLFILGEDYRITEDALVKS